MACPKCGMEMPLQERICPRCKFFPEENRVVSVTPPRSKRKNPPEAVPIRARLRMAWPSWLKWRSGLVYLAAVVVPGLGHIILGHRRRGFTFLAVVGGLLAASISLFGGTVGQLLYGTAASIHAYTIFDLTPYRRSESFVLRAGATLGILLGLMMLAYWPLMTVLANAFVEPVRAAPWLPLSMMIFAVIFAPAAVLLIMVAIRLRGWRGRSLRTGRDY